MSEGNVTVVKYIGDRSNYHCGYCKEDDCRSFGMWTYQLTVDDYQDLINRGWRRSGQYCYKPDMPATCCPSYTIKCDTRNFKPTKSQKKIIKRMNKFLLDGIHDKPEKTSETKKCEEGDGDGKSGDECDTEINHMETAAGSSNSLSLNDFNFEKIMDTIKKTIYDVNPLATELPSTSLQVIEKCSMNVEEKCSKITPGLGADSDKPPCKKAKLLRIERKREKLAQQGIQLPVKKSFPDNNEKNLMELFNETPVNGAHKLKILTVPSEIGATQESFELYCKYQLSIHNDKPQKLTKRRYESFLVESSMEICLVPVKGNEFFRTIAQSYNLYKKYQTIIHNDPPESEEDYLEFLQKSPMKTTKRLNGPTVGYGSFHQQYWLDDKLIAVAVIDILPYCISSVYFFYDPDYGFLSLGFYSSLREINYTQQLAEHTPELCYYYMGFYIHSCPKMRYKGKLSNSYLLCPEIYSWHLLDENLIKKLDETKYLRINQNLNDEDEQKFSEDDLKLINLLVNTKLFSYEDYVTSGGYPNKSIYLEYGQLVGRNCANKIVLII